MGKEGKACLLWETAATLIGCCDFTLLGVRQSTGEGAGSYDIENPRTYLYIIEYNEYSTSVAPCKISIDIYRERRSDL